MNILSSVQELAGKALGRNLLVVQKYAPVVMTGLGVTGAVAATVLACKATLKLSPVVDEFTANRTLLDEVRVAKTVEEYPETFYRKDIAVVYTQSAWSLAKLYAPAVCLGVVSVTLILGGQNILWQRNVALGAAYTGLQTAFNQYRTRIAEQYGPEKEWETYNGFTKQTLQVEEEGKPVEKVVNVTNTNLISPYAKVFAEGNPNWKRDREWNLMFLRQAQNHLNDILRIQKHVFLNDVYDAIAVPRTSAGAVCGWVAGSEGDGYIDFGIYDTSDSRKNDFVNGYEDGILLNFNVDGVIYDLI